MQTTIHLAKEDREIEDCYPVMAELRGHLTRDEFVRRVKHQATSGYLLAYLRDGEIRAVAGFRFLECLAWERILYVDDLVSASGDRSKGYGSALFDWLVDYAREHGCTQLHLDSRVTRFDAHRFYLRKRMIIECHHFSLDLASS